MYFYKIFDKTKVSYVTMMTTEKEILEETEYLSQSVIDSIYNSDKCSVAEIKSELSQKYGNDYNYIINTFPGVEKIISETAEHNWNLNQMIWFHATSDKEKGYSNRLNNYGIYTIEDLKRLSLDDLKAIKNLGKKGIQWVIDTFDLTSAESLI